MTVATAPVCRVSPDAECVVGRVELGGVDWDLYQRLLGATRDGALRITYDRGRLEIEVPSKLHQRLKTIAGDFISAYCARHRIVAEPAGSATLKRQDRDGGCEADESFYFAEARRMAAVDDLDLEAGDPPPELAVEIDLSPPRVHKQSVYARLGVPEIWRWRDGRLSVLLRGANGRYAASDRSRCLPDFPLDRLAAAMSDPNRPPATELVEAFGQSLSGDKVE